MSKPYQEVYWGSPRVRSFSDDDDLIIPQPWHPNPRWPLWFSTCRVGDVVMTGRGTERVIRETSRTAEPRHPTQFSRLWLVFSILHCSWTESCYTCYSANDLCTLGYSHTGHRIPLRTEIDRRIRHELMKASSVETTKRYVRKLDCCGVEGVR